MLRRPATTLQITSEDVAAYESRRVREAHAAQRAAQQQQEQQEQMTGAVPEEDTKEERIRRRRDERIGVGRRG